MFKWISEKLDGHKTTISGVGGILAGLAAIVKALAAGEINPSEIWDGVLIVVAGFGVLGLGGKAQKLLDAGGSKAKAKK